MVKIPRTHPRHATISNRTREARSAPTAARRSNIETPDYDPETRQLTVTFHNGRRYRYSDIGQDMATDYECADSKGTFLRQHINGKFPHEILPD